MELFNLDLNPHLRYTYRTVEAVNDDLQRQIDKMNRISEIWSSDRKNLRLAGLYERQKQIVLEMEAAIALLNRNLYN